ncbi:MAG: phosphonate metabolism transcriptional regulator PhnF [Devosia sp.]
MPRRLGQWEEVETTIAAEIAAGRWKPGDRLPTEPELCARFSVGRHSLRRAVMALVAAGRLRVQQGSGTFVADQAMLRYQIGPQTRFRRNLAAQGVTPSGEVVIAETLPAPAHVAAALTLPEGAPVHRVTMLGRADGVPINISHSWHPAERFPDLADQRRAGRPLSDIYADHGLADYRRRNTTISARPALREEARLLAQPEGHPVLVALKTDIAPDRMPIGYSEAIWAAGRVQFTIETPNEDTYA